MVVVFVFLPSMKSSQIVRIQFDTRTWSWIIGLSSMTASQISENYGA